MSVMRSLKAALRRALLPSELMPGLERMRMTQGQILGELNRAKPVMPIRDCEFGVFSQWGEDGIIQKLVQALPMAHHTFIEFGVEDFVESNCRYLMMNNNWRGFVIDGSEARVQAIRSARWFWKHDLQARCAMITRDNINSLLEESGFDRDVGVMSIDVDGVDYWLLDAITSYTPRILIVEYNALFGSDRAITVPYDAAFVRRQQHYSDLYFGASLAALAHVAAAKGYSLVGTEQAGVNAFFVRNDLMTHGLRALTVHEAFTPTRVRQSRNREGKLDYLSAEHQAAVIRGLPVVNVVSGATEKF